MQRTGPVEVSAQRTNAIYPIFEFNGLRYYRRPRYRYYRSDPGKGGTYLHRDVWSFHHGVIPEDCHIHHVDGDPTNNDPGNLECKTGSDHMAYHMAEPGRKETSSKYFKIAVFAAAEKRNANPEWSSGVSRNAGIATAMLVAALPSIDAECAWCHKPYKVKAIFKKRGFCSASCQGMARKASGVDDESRCCTICGSSFNANRYAKTQTCSTACKKISMSRARIQFNRERGALLLR